MKTNNPYDDREIDVKELFHVVVHKIWIVCLSGIGLAFLLFVISYFIMDRKYESTTQLYILSNQDSSSEITYTDLETSSYLIKDYMVLVTSRLVTNQVISDLGLNMKHEELLKYITVENPEETRILNIKVEYKDPVIARRIADSIRDTTTGLITSITQNEQAIRIVEANEPEAPSKPNIKFNTVLGGAIGGMIGVFIIVLYHLSDDTLKTSVDIEKYLEIKVIGSIPKEKKKTFKIRRYLLLKN